MPLRFTLRVRRYWAAGAILILGFAVTFAAGWLLHHQAVELDQKRFALRIGEFTDQLDGRIEKTEQLLQQLQDFLMLTGESRRRVFDEWISRRGVDFNYPWLYGVAVATNRHGSQWRRELPQPLKTWSAGDWRRFRELAAAQPIECVVALRSPRARGRFLDDYGLKGSLPETNGSILTAQRIQISGRRPVMLDTQGAAIMGVFLSLPVYEAGLPEFMARLAWDDPRRGGARWLHLDSMIVAPVDFCALVKAIRDGKESDLGVELFSSTNQTAATWLNLSADGPRAADPRFKTYLAQRVRWRQYGRNFSIFFHTTPLFEAQSPRRLARTATASGAGLTLLATALVGVSLRARARQEHMTAEVLEARDALAAAERERVKLGHDLHDGAIQSLYAVQLGLTLTAENVESSLPDSSRVLNQTRERVDEVITELRRFILARESGAEAVEPVGLDRVLAAMVERLQPTTPAKIGFESQPGAAARLTTAQAVQLTQLARTALANCLRHAGARRIDVTLRGGAGGVSLEITDDGTGFDANQAANGGMGLTTMQSRAAEAGGLLEVRSQPGKGTRIIVSLPVTEADGPAGSKPTF